MIILNAPVCFCQNGRIIGNELYAPTKSEKARGYYNAGHRYIEEKNFGKAIENFRLSITADTNYIDAYDNMGIAFRQLNMLDSAEHCYLVSRRKYPKGTVAIRNLAIVEDLRGNYKKAYDYYKQALAIDNKDPEAYYGLSRECLYLKQYPEALENGNMVEKLYKQMNSPYMGDCYYNLCIIHLIMNNKALSKSYMELAQKAGVKIDQAISDALKQQ